MASTNDVLKKYWGFENLRPAQKTAIDAVLKKRDVIALLPTGGGKSICFQLPTMMTAGICIVVSPLISLMQDQVKSLKNLGIKAIMLGGHIPYKELMIKLDNCEYGNYKFLYLSPERLQQSVVQERIQSLNVNLIAIDEAHCISEWGHDFRPTYRETTVLKDYFPDVPTIALTATATTKVLSDIKTNLSLEKAKLVRKSFARENIALLIKKTEDKNYELKKYLKKNPGISIVYVRSRKLTLSLSNFFKNHNISASAYHGGLSTSQKQSLLKGWQDEEFKVMVATNAFGMGIDKANVRNVIHYHLPESLENYYQEIGRAGRDGKEGKAFLAYNNADILRVKDQFLRNAPTPKKTKFIYKKLNSYLSIAYGEGEDTEHNFNFLKFCKTYNLNTYLAYNVFQFLDRLNVLTLSREFHQRTEIHFKISNRALYPFLEENPHFKKLVHALLRMQGGFFEFKTRINLQELMSKTGYRRQKINSELKKLEQLNVIGLTLADQDSTVYFEVPREDDRTINPLVPYIKQYYKNKKYKIDCIIQFIENKRTCKVIQILKYFGEKKLEKCGKCSVCRQDYPSGQNKQEWKLIRKSIIEKLKHDNLNSKQLTVQLEFSEENILFILKAMLDKGDIKLTNSNTYVLK